MVFACTYAKSQKFYVEKTDGGFEKPIIEALMLKNIKVSFKKDSSDYTLTCMVGKTGMGRSKCSIYVINSVSGDVIAKSKEVNGQTAAWNGYANPSMLAVKRIADKYLLDLIKTLIKK
jgi:hypothetical protein